MVNRGGIIDGIIDGIVERVGIIIKGIVFIERVPTLSDTRLRHFPSFAAVRKVVESVGIEESEDSED